MFNAQNKSRGSSEYTVYNGASIVIGNRPEQHYSSLPDLKQNMLTPNALSPNAAAYNFQTTEMKKQASNEEFHMYDALYKLVLYCIDSRSHTDNADRFDRVWTDTQLHVTWLNSAHVCFHFPEPHGSCLLCIKRQTLRLAL